VTWTPTPPSEGQPVPSLLTDQDYTKFATLDIQSFLTAAGERIREYCGWHIYPELTTQGKYDLSGDGTIMLPTTHLTGVSCVSPPYPDANPIAEGSYFWDERGWISFTPYQYGFAPTPASVNLWPIDTVRLFDAYPKHNLRLNVTFTHGYPTVPSVVAEVGYELLMRTLEKPAGVASQVQAGPYKFVFQEFGLILSDDQKNRLAKYRLPAVS
jgi:hypothetical protein